MSIIATLGILPSRGSANAAPYPGLSELINPVTRFGVVGDGATDNSTALMAMRAYMASKPNTHFEVRFPANGHYCYVNNRWLNNVRSVAVYGNGSRFECIATSAQTWNRIPLGWRHLWDDAPPDNMGMGQIPCGQARFARAVKGATTITLKAQVGTEPYEPITNFAAGDYVFIWADDKQFFGYPPNLTNFEWKTVKSVNTGAGTITFTEPLKYTYEENLREDSGDWDGRYLHWGSARIFKLDRAVYKYPRFIGLYDMVITPNRSLPGDGQGLQPVGDVVDIDNVDHTGDDAHLWLGMSRHVEVRNSRFRYSDIDKLGGYLGVTNCVFLSNFGPASGFQDVVLEDSVVTGHVGICARNNTIRGCTITPENQYGGISISSVTNVDSFIAEDNTIINNTNLWYGVDTNNLSTFSPFAVDGYTIVMQDTEKNRTEVINKMDVGTRLIRGKDVATIQQMTYDAASSVFRIVTDRNDFLTSDVITRFMANSLIASNNKFVGAKTWEVRDPYLVFRNGPLVIDLPIPFTYKNMLIYGTLTRITLEVIREQRNLNPTYPNPTIHLAAYNHNGAEVTSMVAYTAAKGAVSTGPLGNYVTGANSVLTSLAASNFVRNIYIQPWYHGLGGKAGFSGKLADYPIVRLTIKGTSVL